jgi:hypothetical protein
MKIAVVIEAKEGSGNLAIPGSPLYMVIGQRDASNGYQEQTKKLDILQTLGLRQQVFEVGEILILDESGREVGFPGRKPEKWDVRIKYVQSFEQAAAVSDEAMQLYEREEEKNEF